MAIERVYNVPLREGYMKAPMYRRAKKAVNTLRTFLAKTMRVNEKDVNLGKYVNLLIWKHGIKNPPHHVKVNVKKDDEGMVYAELVGAPVEETAVITTKKAITEVEDVKSALAGEGSGEASKIKDAEVIEETKFEEPINYQTDTMKRAYITKKPSALEAAAGLGEEKASGSESFASEKKPKKAKAKKEDKEQII